MTVYTLSNFKELEKFFRRLAAIDVEAHSEAPSTIVDRKKEEKPKEPEKIDIPKFLTKSSSTYYRRATEEEITIMKESRERKQKKEESAKTHSKRPSHNRVGSLDYSRLTKNTNMTADTINPLITIPETTERIADLSQIDLGDNTSGRKPEKKDLFSLPNKLGVGSVMPKMSARGNKNDYNAPVSNSHRGDFHQPLSTRDDLQPRRTLPPHIADALTEDKALVNMVVTPAGGDGIDKPVRRHRRIQSMQVVPKNILMNLTSPKESAREAPDKISSEQQVPTGVQSPVSNRSLAGQQCLVCFDKEPDAVFMECGHGGVCYECALEVWKSTGECYLCRDRIVQVLQVDLKTKLEGNVIKVLSSTQMVMYEEDDPDYQ